MFSATRARVCFAAARPSLVFNRAALARYATGPPSTTTPVETIETNSTPIEEYGFQGEPIAETSDEAREVLSKQAPNRVETWSRSQQPRDQAMTGPRFEQTIMKLQVCI